jgi:hypothetical protein
MDSSPPPSLPLHAPLPRPARGACTRLRLGASEVILEAVRGGHTLLWTNGRQARRYALGLPADGQLSVQLRAPRYPVQVVPREVLAIVPRGRLTGYVNVSLVPTVQWHTPTGQVETLLQLHPEDLTAEWDEASGHAFTAASAWLVRFPMRNGEPRVVVPVRLRNDSGTTCSPASLPVTLRDDELLELRGCIVARVRRLTWLGSEFVCTSHLPSPLGEAS